MEDDLKAALGGRPVIVVSNRGPASFINREAVGRGAGGLVTTLRELVKASEGAWVAAATTAGDREVAAEQEIAEPVSIGGEEFNLLLVEIDPETYDGYYSTIANPLLWFLQHYMWDLPYEPVITEDTSHAWYKGYVAANRLFAHAVIEQAAANRLPPVIMFQDYHLYIAPRFVRSRVRDAVLTHFVHIPWPQSDYWRILPSYMRTAIFHGILANDLVGFQSRRNVFNFLRSCEDLFGMEVDYANKKVRFEKRWIWVRSYPVSIDPDEFRALGSTEAVGREEARIEALRKDLLLVRTDRTDLSKNTIRGFKAYDIFLSDHPEYQEKITFVAHAYRSRQSVPQYARYLERIEAEAELVNKKYGTDGWQPIALFIEDNFDLTLALYKHFDVLLVNPIYDGMNLVSKEGAILNDRLGRVILSENAGSHQELADAVLSVNPFDVQATANAIYRAVVMPEAERQWRSWWIKETVTHNDVKKWLLKQTDDIRAMTEAAKTRVT